MHERLRRGCSDRQRARARGQMSCELQTLRFTARQRRHRLTELQVIETDLGQRLQLREHFLLACEKLNRFCNGHIEHVRNAGRSDPAPSVSFTSSTSPR